MKLNKYILQWEKHDISAHKIAILAPSEKWVKKHFEEIEHAFRFTPEEGGWVQYDDFSVEEVDEDDDQEDCTDVYAIIRSRNAVRKIEMEHFDDILVFHYCHCEVMHPTVKAAFEYRFAISEGPDYQWQYPRQFKDFSPESIEHYLSQMQNAGRITVRETHEAGGHWKLVTFTK